jgi:hypothetical protein
MKKQIITLTVALFAVFTGLRADDTSNLLIQGDFGTGGTLETFKWQVSYATGYLSSGRDLLSAVFGQPVLIGTYTDTYGTFPEYQAGNASQAVDYYYYSSPTFSAFSPISFTLNGTTILQDPSTSPGWNSYVAGGSGAYGPNDDGDGTPYSDGTWTFANDGIDSRTVSDGSYDGWVFGSTIWNSAATIDDSTGATAPTSSEFAQTNSTSVLTVVSVPEPATPALFGGAAALAALMLWKKKARA